MHDTPTPTVEYRRRLGLFSTTMMVIGGIIGAGIFLNPAVVAARVHTAGLTLAAWGLGALIALIGAFVFAELAERRPLAGGGYAYLREAFGPLVGFLYAWAILLVIGTGAIAAVAVTFSRYAVALFGWPDSLGPLLAALAILSLSGINALGIRSGAWTQNLFTVLKLLAIAVLVLVALFGQGHAPTTALAAAPPPNIVLALAAALVPVLFAYGGWQQTNFIAAEIIEPTRTLPRALVLGVVVVVAAYLLVNVAYLRTLGAAGLATSSAPAAETMAAVAGRVGERLISAGIVASTFGFLNLVILVSPRVYQTMAHDGLFFPSLARLHPTWRTPVAAIVLQGGWAVILLFTRTYGQLLDYVVFADWIFFGLCAVALFIFRRRDGDRTIAFRVPLHPLSTLTFVAAAGYVLVGSIWSNPGNALRGAALLALGIPIFLYRRQRARSS